jgi:predicted nucleotidyltransferase component of viral defense system
MISAGYKNQVRLLLSVLPEIAHEKCFAMHGGTAINLFVRDMPRLSVDIDLTYTPFEDRTTAFKEINTALSRISSRIATVVPDAKIEHKTDNLKLLIRRADALVKVEVNQIARGTIGLPEELELCLNAQEEFDMFCVMPVVPFAQLYGGKLCAALDRQHPRDLFDVRYFLNRNKFTPELMKGFLLCLLSHEKPVHELLFPNRKDQLSAYQNQFAGMTAESFTYEDYLNTREEMIMYLHKAISPAMKDFIIRFHKLEPVGDSYDFSAFPAIKWKLQNIQRLKDENPNKYAVFLTELNEKFARL